MNPLDSLDLKKTEQQIRALCRRWNCPEQDRNDVVQEAFLVMLETGGAVTAAASKAMRRVCGRGEDALQYVDSLNNVPEDIVNPNQQAEWENGLGRLTDKERQLLEWRKAGYTLKEIGAKLGITYETVRMRLGEAREFAKRESTRKGT